MEITIKYKDIISRCEQLSSFEAEGRVDANGESRYLELHINKVDEQLILMYVNQARGIIEERLSRMISGVTDVVAPDAYEFDFISSVIPANEVDSLDDRSPVAYFTDGDAFAYYQETNTDVYDVQYIDIDGPKYGYDGSPLGTVYLCKADNKMYTWSTTTEGLEEYTRENSFTWGIRTNTRWNGIKSFTRHINESIVSYAMAHWLKGKLDDRVPFYENLHETMLALAEKNIFTKQAP